MNSPSEPQSLTTEERYQIRLATPMDAAELLEIYEADDFAGDFSVSYTRRPDPYSSLAAEGDRLVAPVVVDHLEGHIAGMGACIIRDGYISGEVRSIGYLTGLKGRPEYRRGVPLIPQVYDFLRDHSSEVACYYTAILASNRLTLRMLGRDHPGMPHYQRVGVYTTTILGAGASIPDGSRALVPVELRAVGTTRGDLAATSLDAPGGSAQGWQLLDVSGRPVAGCALWRQHHKQYVVTGVSDEMQAALANVPGLPPLPKIGQPVRHASVAGLWAHDLDAARDLLRHLAAVTADVDYLFAGFLDTHPLAACVEGLPAFSYDSVLFTVHWDWPPAAGRPGQLEVDPATVDVPVGLL